MPSIHKNDILRFVSKDTFYSRRIMLALQDECGSLPIRARELNDWMDKDLFVNPEKVYVVGQKLPNETDEEMVRRFLPAKYWAYSPALYRENVMKGNGRKENKANLYDDHKKVRKEKEIGISTETSTGRLETTKVKIDVEGSRMRKTKNVSRAIVLINEETKERKDFSSIYAAARFLGGQFMQIQRAALYNGAVYGWRVYESAESIRQHIRELQEQLAIVEGLPESPTD